MIQRANIRSILKTALDAHATFAAKGIVAFLDDGLTATDDAMDEKLSGEGTPPGVVLVILPLLGSDNQDETGSRLAERVEVRVDLRINAIANAAGAQLTQEAGQDIVIGVLLKLGQSEGLLEGLRFDRGSVTELLAVAGEISTAFYCSVPVDTSAAA